LASGCQTVFLHRHREPAPVLSPCRR
jgi:hypothetical protein